MLEIIAIWWLAVYIGNLATLKGLKKRRYQVMMILLWICCEFIGIAVGFVLFGGDELPWQMYALALLGASAGAGIAILIMKILPARDASASTIEPDAPPLQKFGQSIWIPVIMVLLGFCCLCAACSIATTLQVSRDSSLYKATNPIIGIELSNAGQISRQVNEISSNEKAIFFGFYLETPPRVREVPVKFDWYINGNIAYSFSKDFGQGTVVVVLDREELGMSEFNEGNYEVVARLGDKILTSAKFVVMDANGPLSACVPHYFQDSGVGCFIRVAR